MPLLGAVVESFEVPDLRLDWSVQTYTSFSKLHRDLIKGCTMGRLWEAGETITRALGKSHQDLTFTCDCTECYLDMCMGGRVSSSRPLQAPGPHKMDAAILGSS